MSNLVKLPLDRDTVRLKRVYESEALKDYKEKNVTCNMVEDLYGELSFDSLPEDRPYLYTSLVTSIDGRIAYSDAPQGPLIAKLNRYDENGAAGDWWILNMLRTISDGIMVGAGTMQAEPDFTGHVFYEELETARRLAGKGDVPCNIITSLDGTDIPFDHILFTEAEVPVMVSVSKAGASYVENHMNTPFVTVDISGEITEEAVRTAKENGGKTVIIASGETMPDSVQLMKFLKKIGIDRLLVETPSYMHYLLSLRMMDELFLNYSCVYLGGNALTIGKTGKEFTSLDHPHTKMLSIHTHSDHFFYFRHKMIY